MNLRSENEFGLPCLSEPLQLYSYILFISRPFPLDTDFIRFIALLISEIKDTSLYLSQK